MKTYSEKIEFAEATLNRGFMGLPAVSISEILGMISEPFNQEEVATKTYNKRYNDESSEYYHKTVEEIIEMWANKGKVSMQYGRMLDDYIGIRLTGSEIDYEMYKLDNDVDDDPRLQGLVSSFDNFLSYIEAQDEWEFAAREVPIYYSPNGEFVVKGRFDALFRNKKTGKWIVVDWKSSGTVDKVPTRWTTNFLGAAKMYPALNWYSYTMQVYFYKTALIANYLPAGTTVDDVDVLIVQLPGANTCSDGKNYEAHGPAFVYDKSFMDRLFTFGYKKKLLLEQKDGK